jgi:hypothetical protein
MSIKSGSRGSRGTAGFHLKGGTSGHFGMWDLGDICFLELYGFHWSDLKSDCSFGKPTKLSTQRLQKYEKVLTETSHSNFPTHEF